MYNAMERWVGEKREDQPWNNLNRFRAQEESEINLCNFAGEREDTISLGCPEYKETRGGEGQKNERV